jgi:hypothetical protein
MIKWFLLISLFFASLSSEAARNIQKNIPKKIITVSVNEKGWVMIGRDTLTIDQLTDELQKRLWKGYLGTGEMFDAIRLEFSGLPPAVIQKSARDAIKEAQRKALVDISVQKHERRFEDLSSRQQKKIKKQFPVLFQTNYE